jgi:hypothetical protein
VTALGVPRRRLGALGAAWSAVELRLLWLGFAAIVLAAVAVVAKPSWFDLPGLTEQLPRLLAASAVYMLGHAFRFLRLALLIHKPSIRLRRVMQVHFFTAGLGVLLPFKLSELVRVREVGVVTGSLRTGLLAVWLERTLDAAVLAVLIGVVALEVPDAIELVTPLLIVVCAFVAITVVLITVVPANIREAMLHIVRRPFGERSVGVLRALRAALATLQEAPRMLRGRLPSLVLLSVLIWAAEVGAVAIAISGSGLDATGLSTAVLSLLATVSAGATAIMSSAGEQLSDALQELGGVFSDVGLYRLALVLPLLVAAAWSAAAYLPWRGRRRLIGSGS